MNEYIINPGTPQERVVRASKYQLVDGYFWFLGIENQVISINKADFINRIDLIS